MSCRVSCVTVSALFIFISALMVKNGLLFAVSVGWRDKRRTEEVCRNTEAQRGRQRTALWAMEAVISSLCLLRFLLLFSPRFLQVDLIYFASFLFHGPDLRERTRLQGRARWVWHTNVGCFSFLARRANERWKHRNSDPARTQTDRQTNRHTNRQTDRMTSYLQATPPARTFLSGTCGPAPTYHWPGYPQCPERERRFS